MNKAILLIALLLLDLSTLNAAIFLKKNESGNFSADLQDVDLSTVIKSIEKSYGVNFTGVEFLTPCQVSVSFKDLPLEKALNRILSKKISYVFKYNNQGEVISVTLLQENKLNREPSQKGQETNVAGSNQGSKPIHSIAHNVSSEKVKADNLEISGEAQEKDTSFRTVPNASPPGGEGNTDNADASKHFKIIQNAQPPGGSGTNVGISHTQQKPSMPRQ